VTTPQPPSSAMHAPPSDRPAVARSGDGVFGWTFGVLAAATVASGLQLVTGAPPGLMVVLAVGVTAVAARRDLQSRRIPNDLTYPAITIGLVLQLAAAAAAFGGLATVVAWLGGRGPVDGLLGLAGGVAIGLAGYAIGGIGGGDAKLLAAIGVLLGWRDAAGVYLDALLIGLLLAAAGALTGGRMLAGLRRLAAATGGEGPAFRRGEIPLAVALFAATLTATLWPLHEAVQRLLGAGPGAAP